jgi:hypothetical protein
VSKKPELKNLAEEFLQAMKGQPHKYQMQIMREFGLLCFARGWEARRDLRTEIKQ